jgi:hypothetical protein
MTFDIHEFLYPPGAPLKSRAQATVDCSRIAHLLAVEARRLGDVTGEGAFANLLADALFSSSERLYDMITLQDPIAWGDAIDAEFRRILALDFAAP